MSNTARRNPFNPFRIDKVTVDQVNREFDLVKTAFSSVEAEISGLTLQKGDPGPSGVPGPPGPSGTGKTVDLYLSYGGVSDGGGDGDLPTPPGGEGQPTFFLRPTTNSNVILVEELTPGSEWEFVVPAPIADSLLRIDLMVYSCSLVTAGIGLTPTLTASLTRNGSGSPVMTSVNLNGLTNTIVTVGPTSGTSYIANDTMGVLVTSNNVGSGFLVMTAHVTG